MAETRNGQSAPSFGRVMTAMVTPFDSSGEVDYEQAQELAQMLIASGSDGVVVAGTTGAAPTLTKDEKLDLVRAVKQAVGRRGHVLAGTSSYNTAESIELSHEAETAGADGLLLTVPYYNKPSQEGIYRHMQAIASAVNIPCVLYNIPGRTSVNMSPESIVRSAATPNIVGVKEASGNLDAISKIVEEAGPEFRVWSGDDQMTLPLLSVGGYGVISVCTHLVGEQMKAMVQAFVSGRVAEAAQIHRRLLPLMTALMTVSSNPTPIKHALNEVGCRVGGLRLPLFGLDDLASERLMAEVRRYRIDLPIKVEAMSDD